MARLIWVLVMAILQLRTVTGSTPDGGFPAIFVFGDSLSDSGNNNKLVTVAKANYYPNGIDFPDGPTGRFCNGFTTIDHIATMMGLPLIPPFNSEATKGAKILRGVNYASGSAGILSDTGSLSGDIFTMDDQIQNFQKTIDQLRVELLKNGTNNSEEFLAKSLFFVSMGSNDFISNYLGTTSVLNQFRYTLDKFIDLLLEKFRKQLQDLYSLGGRRFLVTGLPPIGCAPKQVGLANLTGCVDRVNQMAAKFNEKLQPLLIQLKEDLPEANFVYGEIFFLSLNMINNPSPHGFKYRREACCTLEGLTNQVPCLPDSPVCENRSEYIFWDRYHPTSTWNRIIAEQSLPVVKSLLD